MATVYPKCFAYPVLLALLYVPTATCQSSQSPATVISSSPTSDTPDQPPTESIICGPAHVLQCLKDIGKDQAGIWTSPLRIQTRDAIWLAPFAAATAVAIHYDPQARQELGTHRGRIDTSNAISQFGATYTLVGEGGAMYAIGRFTHNDHLAETGRLGTEAVIDAILVSEVIKLAANRERPDEGNGTGGFWAHGTRSYSDSFPSGHAIESWAFARTIASEYPNKWTQIGVYSLATAISVSRVTSLRHFPSDALVGSVLGYLIGGYVVNHHAADSIDSGFSFSPLVNVSTHTFGASITVRPGEIQPETKRFISYLRR